jgi:ATP-dependent helicase HrpA
MNIVSIVARPLDNSSVIAGDSRSEQRRLQRFHARPRPTFPDDLPIVQKRDEIAKAILENQVTILCGETGSGKTTQLPKICLDIGRGIDGLIGHTQPRRIAARSVAARIAEELQTSVGQAVGYKIRFGDRTGENTYIKVMTDGILLAEIQSDRLLRQYDTLIIDEAHERSLNIDFLLGYLRQLLPKRPDLKVIVTSATIDPERFSRHFDNAPIITVSGRTYPVEVRYRPLKSDDPEEEDIEQVHGIVAAVEELARLGWGDVLVFLSGEREIRETAEELRKHHPPQTEILPLYARLSGAEQSRIFQPHGRRRIVLATNVAETSLTVPGIKYVIDAGYARISRYSPRTKVQRLPIEVISQASADQRKGRCGRVSEGVCIRLYSEEDFASRARFTEPEILRTNLAAVILQMKTARLGEIEQFPFLERPDSRLIRDGYLTLHELGAVDDENELTEIGRQLGRLPVDPRVGRMILAADKENCLSEVLIIAAALSVQDPRERPVELAAVADEAHKQFIDENSDFLGYLKIWDFFREKSKHLSNNQQRRQCKQQFLSYLRLREWHEVHQQLHAVVTEMGWKPNHNEAHADRIHRSLLTGLLSNVGNKTETSEYAGLRGAKFNLFPGSVLFSQRPKWVMSAELVETNRLYARTVAKVMPEWIERAAAHLIKRTYSDPQWSSQRGDVIAGERVSLKGLILVPHRTVCYGPIDPRTAREVFIHSALVEGDFRCGGEFLKHNLNLLHEIKRLEAKTRRRDLLAEPAQRFAFYHSRIPMGIFNSPLFEKWRKAVEPDEPRLLFMDLLDIARAEVREIPAGDFPDEIAVGNLKIELTYVHDAARADDGITANVPLAILNQLPAGPFDWLVPGWLEEKVIELIRTLPKAIRTKLVPAPDAAAKALAAIRSSLPSSTFDVQRSTFELKRTSNFELRTSNVEVNLANLPGETDFDRSAPFLAVIAHQLGKLIGETIPLGSFDVAALPNWLKMNFRILDAAGKSIAMGRDLVALRNELGVKARESFAALPPPEFTRNGLKSWDFGDLPERIEIQRGSAAFSGFPALIDNKQSVGIRVLDSREASLLANRAGVRRLFMLQLNHEMKQLVRDFEHVDQMSLLYKPLGSWSELKEELLSAAFDRSLFDPAEDIRSREVFVNRAQDAWRRLTTASRQLNKVTYEILQAFGQINTALDREYPPLLLASIQEMRDQLRKLMPKNFLSATPPDWLQHLPRYLQAIEIRHRKLMNAGLPRDQEVAGIIRPLSAAYTQRRTAHAARGFHDPELTRLWWMLQELRVSLFAQELKTAFPISVQRVEKQLSLIAS